MTILKTKDAPNESVTKADEEQESGSKVSIYARLKTARTFWSGVVLLVLFAVWQLVTQMWDNAFFPTPMTIFAALPSVLTDTGVSTGTSPLVTDVVTSI